MIATFRTFPVVESPLGCCERPSRNPDSGLPRLGRAKPNPSRGYASELPKLRPEAAGILLLAKKTARGVCQRAARGSGAPGCRHLVQYSVSYRDIPWLWFSGVSVVVRVCDAESISFYRPHRCRKTR